MDNKLYYLAFSHFLGIGPVKFSLLLSHYKSLSLAYNAKKGELEELLGSKLAQKFVDFRNKFNPEKKYQEIKKKGILLVTQEDKSYPEQFKNIADPPICLYVKGDINQFNFGADLFFAIVGTRKPTAYGEQITRKFARDLSEAGFVIVSGLAHGIDAISHKTAIEAGGRTIAFLGCGVDIIYPSANTKLYYEIINNRGLIISEFPPGQTVLKGLFIARNRLISGLSKGVLVAEGAKDSGALITASYAGEQGIEVFAPPAPITSYLSEAPNSLLKKGAKLVTNIQDILEEFNLKLCPKENKELINNLPSDEKMIFNLLMKEAETANNLAILSNFDISQTLKTLSLLEIKGLVRRNIEGEYEVL